MSIAKLFSLFKQTHDHKCTEPALPYYCKQSGYELPELYSGSLVYGELAALAEHKCEERHEVLSHHRCEPEVALRPEVEVPVHAEVSSPWVIVHGA